ncbi:MAG: glycoside hydrolase family 52 protein [Planctomycetes bacterium]|nr:glycoside hydrolase family 52 protein [Planctomycetota bacterium]
MTWTVARLGSRFSLVFEPYRRRIMHSALGRFLDEPVDLMVGLIEPDGTERVLPFTTRGKALHNTEQFERLNSITFRGFSETYRLRFEFNIHAVFYPQDEELCVMPAFYLEMRANPVERVRWFKPAGKTPKKVKLFIRLQRGNTRIAAAAGANGEGSRIDLEYDNRLQAKVDDAFEPYVPLPDPGRTVKVRERIVSLNPGVVPDADGAGLTLELPVTEQDSGIKWRLVWGAHVEEPILDLSSPAGSTVGRFRYNRYWRNIDEVMQAAVSERDDRLALSRRMEKLIDQAPLYTAQRHLISQSFHAYLANTFWCDLDDGHEWFSVWDGGCFFHSTVDVEYNVSLFYLTLWPRLLGLELNQWPGFEKKHNASGGSILSHDMGIGNRVGRQAYPHDMPVEENCNYLLMLQAYAHWTGDLSIAKTHGDFIERLAKYVLWTDRDGSGFPSEGTANTIDDASPATQYARKQTYLAVKRITALQAAADILARLGRTATAAECTRITERDAGKIEKKAWLGDHFAVCVDPSTAGIKDARTGKQLPYEEMPGWDAYSIYTANGLLLPLVTGQPCPFDTEPLATDLVNASRETLGRYGCGHTSYEVENTWVSQNIWRDHLANYLGAHIPRYSQQYWDMQVMSNTGDQSLGCIDSYIGNNLSFYPRAVASMGWFISEPRVVIDRLAPNGTRISVEPDTTHPQRWPLLALADWKAGKVPVCVVDANGRVNIESEIDPVIVRGSGAKSGVIG